MKWSVHADDMHHISKVLRLAPGTIVELTDGAGTVAKGTLSSPAWDALEVDVLVAWKEPEVPAKLIAAIGCLKNSDMDLLIPSLVEAGVDAMHVFLLAGDAKFRANSKAKERWQKSLRESVKQSKRAYLPALTLFPDFKSWLAASADLGAKKFFLAAQAEHSAVAADIGSADVLLAIGSEKGFSEAECQELAKADFRSLRLGPYVQRARTAAVVGAGILAARLSPKPKS